jgi:hypothetical protein
MAFADLAFSTRGHGLHLGLEASFPPTALAAMGGLVEHVVELASSGASTIHE